MFDVQIKICPKCQKPSALQAKFCDNCGHQYRTLFTAEPDKTQVVSVIPLQQSENKPEEGNTLATARLRELEREAQEHEGKRRTSRIFNAVAICFMLMGFCSLLIFPLFVLNMIIGIIFAVLAMVFKPHDS